MKIYVSHSKDFNYMKELYLPLKKSSLYHHHEIIFSSDRDDRLVNFRDILKGCDAMIAEVSGPSISLGVELTWADFYNVKIICIYKKGAKIPASLKIISDHFLEYEDEKDLISVIENILNQT